MDDSQTFTFEDGSSWTVRTYLSHGTARAMAAAARKTFTPSVEVTPEMIIKGDIEVNWAAMDFAEANDILVLKSTIEWSYGPVNENVLEIVDEKHFQQVLDLLNELHGSNSPLAEAAQSG